MIPVSPVPFWQYFDLITLSILLSVTAVLVMAQRKSTGKLLGTISQSVAHTKRSSLIFSIFMTICYPLYYAFVWLWVGPLVDAPTIFYYLLAGSALCEMVFVWVPATTGMSHKIHAAMAYVVGVEMFVFPVIILLYGQNVSSFAQASIIFFLVTGCALLSLMIFKKLRTYTFLYETIYSVVFLLTVSIIAHS